ncbi:MAG: Lecithin:cholesterol acyltransferase [Ferruginibacter sp.]|nr:Lecithin:cholesterol acyltransferase [Ferruginibacter sp.]
MIRKLIINGSENIIVNETAAFDGFDLVKSVNVSNTRGPGTRQEMEVHNEDDIVEIKFEDSTTWIGNATEFQEIFNLAGKRGLDDDGFEIPSSLQSGDRNIVQDLSINVFNFFKKKTSALVGSAVQEIAKKLEDKVQPQPGLFLLDNAMRKKIAGNISNVSKPFLLFIHGTNSNSDGAFGALIDKKQFGLWNYILTSYGDNVLTFDHKTLTHSPLQNALELMQQLPANSILHLITHSRGGLVGDILARVSSGNTNIGFSDIEMNLMDGEGDARKYMEDINALAKQKNITIQKFIRVASPSMGTSLLADRLDHYLNTLLNFVGISTGVAGNPVYAGVKSLLGEVAATKSNVDVLPGVAAMVPESPFIKMLNNPANIIEAPLTVIAGNCTYHLELKALFVILTKFYFRRKNDMVVDTWSMYFGTPRRKDIWFFMDDAKGTDHVHYFRSQDSQEAMTRVLSAATDTIAGFKTLQEADISDANRNAALPFVTAEVKMDMSKITGTKPIAIIIPGIMGSNLCRDDDRIWVDFWSFVKGDLIKLDINAPNITAPSLMGSGYRKLAKYLSNKYDVLPFAYDWRKSLTEEAKKLDDTIKILLAKKQPIHVIAHSMGGVLFREFIMNGAQWQLLNNSQGFKALFLGAPLGGSYLIPETLSGRGGNISKLSMIDLKHGKNELLKVFSQCPGLYHLLPLSNTPYDFTKAKTWQDLLNNTQNIGTLPGDDVLKTFTSFRDNILNNKSKIDYKNIIYIAGKSDATTATYDIAPNGRNNSLVFKSTSEGDGSVTWASGIPEELLQRNAVYYCTTEHGELSNEPAIFGAFTDLLETGFTSKLGKTPPVSRGGGQLTDNPKYEIIPVDAGNIEKIAMGVKKTEKEVITDTPLKITMSNGNLACAQFPLLAGHFYKDGIMSAEKVLDSCFNGSLREKHALGLYPGKVDSSEIILSYTTSPKGAIIIGLGEAGELNGYQLELSVTQGVSRYLLKLRDFEALNKEEFNNIFQTGIGISVLIVGAGYGGLSIESSLKSIILGIKKANGSIAGLNSSTLKKIETVEFVELYEDRSLQAFYILKKLEADQHLNIVLPYNKIKRLPGSRKRVPLDYQQDWWQRVSVAVGTNPSFYLKFTASTGSAREEVRDLNSNPVIIQHFIDKISGDNKWSPQLAKTVFELLVPNDFKDAVRNQYNILWRLDKYSAAFPWELLQDSATQSKPLCVSSGMIRQLATADYRTDIKRSYANNALVIGDPNLDGFVQQLPGAAEEARKVSGIIGNNDFTVTSRINKDFDENLQAIFEREYKMIHLAGHGFFEAEKVEENGTKKIPPSGGMVIGKGIFLTTKEINQMSQVPEFVFINCCFLGKVDGASETLSQQHYRLAANLGVQLIEMGVKAVIAAGWAVDDNSALLFAETFYTEMFAGATFSDAVLKARSECFEKYPDNNTWGAYQCYGEHFYKFTTHSVKKGKAYSYILTMEAEIDLTNLYNKVMDGRYELDWYLEELKAISTAIDKSGIRNGAITEMETKILIALNQQEIAIEKINELVRFEEADYTVNTLENLYNLNIKVTKNAPGKTAADIQAIIDNFSYLLKIGDTSQRHLLLGMANKIMFIKSDADAEKIVALKNAAGEYRKAYEIAKKNDRGFLDPLCNWLQLETMLLLSGKNATADWGKNSVNKYKLPTLKSAMGLLDSMLSADIDLERDYEFWDSLNNANVLLTRLCLQPSGTKPEDIIASIKKYWGTAGAKSKLANGLEHLQLLITATRLSRQVKAKTLGKALEKLSELLTKEAV